MIKRTIEVSRRAAHLSVRHGQLVVQPVNEDKAAAKTIPCEDVGVVLIDHPAVTYTHRALCELTAAGAAVVFCGEDHLPAGLLLPVSTHSQVLSRLNQQIDATQPAKKRLWQQLVAAKVRHQAANVSPAMAARRALDQLATEVRSGDSTNVEAHAARLYWSAWLGPSTEAARSSVTAGAPIRAAGFRRDQDGLDPLNAMLNYGYAVARAAIGRAIVAAGLLPALGVHHHHRGNAFALADDLIEPLRPLVDTRVRHLYRHGLGHDHLDQTTKAGLLALLTHPVQTGNTTGPLMVALHPYLASFVECLGHTGARLVVPTWSEPEPC
ncbi:MAG: type II CRISPR-associated endonuclease Cas1 [Planctomycetota bacterium]